MFRKFRLRAKKSDQMNTEKEVTANEQVDETKDNSQEEVQQETEATSDETTSNEENISEEEKLKKEIADLKDKHIRLFAEFENFRRRTAKEKIELTKNAGLEMMTMLLPILDDYERASKAMNDSDDINEIRTGQELIRTKLVSSLEQKGLRSMESSIGKEFDTDFHEAITQIPAPSEDMKGKIIDEVEKGYLLNDKVIRYAKVVIGQ